MRKRSAKSNNVKKKYHPLPLFTLAVIAVAVCLILLCAGKVSAFFRGSDFFKIKTVTTCGFNEMNLSYLIGKNIFSVNLRKLDSALRARYPQFKITGVWRVFPDRIHLNLRKREPVFQIKANRYMYLDDEGVILPKESDFPDSSLPVLCGVKQIHNPRYGWRYDDLPEFKSAVKVVDGLRKYPELSGFQPVNVDVSDLKNLCFTAGPYGVTVKVGAEDIPGKMRILAILIKQIKTSLNDVEYIDLRFKEPVVKPRLSADSR